MLQSICKKVFKLMLMTTVVVMINGCNSGTKDTNSITNLSNQLNSIGSNTLVRPYTRDIILQNPVPTGKGLLKLGKNLIQF